MKNPFVRSETPAGSFLPEEWVERRAEIRANILCLTLFAIVMAGVVGAFFVTSRQWLQVKRARDTIAAQYAQEAARIEQLKFLEKQRSEIIQRAEVSTALIERVRRSVLLSELANRKPDDITLLEVVLTGKRVQDPPPQAQATPPASGSATGPLQSLGGKGGVSATIRTVQAPRPEQEKVRPPRFEHAVRLTGVARDNASIADYLSALKACPLLENVDLKYIKEATIDKQEMRQFELEAGLRRDADTRGMESVRSGPVRGMPGDDPVRRAPSGVIVHPGTGKE